MSSDDQRAQDESVKNILSNYGGKKSFQNFLDIFLSFHHKAVTWRHLMWRWFEEGNPQGIEGDNLGCSSRDVAQNGTIKKLHPKGQGI